MWFCLYLFLFLSLPQIFLSVSPPPFFPFLHSFFFFFFSPPILVLSLLELSLSLDSAQTQTHMPQALLSNQWISLFSSIRCFSLSLAQINAPSVGPICLGLVVPIGGCEVAVVGWRVVGLVVGWRVGLLLESVCFGVLVGIVEAVFLLFLFGCGFVDCWLLIARFVQFCGYFVNDCIDLIFGFKSIFLLDNLVCVYIWIDFVLYNILLWFFRVWFLGLYDFFGFVLLCVLDGFVWFSGFVWFFGSNVAFILRVNSLCLLLCSLCLWSCVNV